LVGNPTLRGEQMRDCLFKSAFPREHSSLVQFILCVLVGTGKNPTRTIALPLSVWDLLSIRSELSVACGQQPQRENQ